MVIQKSVNNRHFLDIDALDTHSLYEILVLAKEEKRALKEGKMTTKIPGAQLAMIFEKPSTRTRVSFEVGINQLGGDAIMLDARSSQLGRGETVADTACVLSRYVDLIMIRCFKRKTLLELAENASVPVINGLTDFSHPCQVMADIMTFEEHRGDISGKVVAWVGDGNNMVNSWVHAAIRLGFELRIATPKEFAPNHEVVTWAIQHNGKVIVTHDPKEAVAGADLVTTDTWVSMGDADEELRHEKLSPFQVNDALMALADKRALFMHCLPAHRGEEVTDSVMDGAQSVVWDEAENRLHIQKAIMLWCKGIQKSHASN